jgi:hypothetical protein
MGAFCTGAYIIDIVWWMLIGVHVMSDTCIRAHTKTTMVCPEGYRSVEMYDDHQISQECCDVGKRTCVYTKTMMNCPEGYQWSNNEYGASCCQFESPKCVPRIPNEQVIVDDKEWWYNIVTIMPMITGVYLLLWIFCWTVDTVQQPSIGHGVVVILPMAIGFGLHVFVDVILINSNICKNT